MRHVRSRNCASYVLPSGLRVRELAAWYSGVITNVDTAVIRVSLLSIPFSDYSNKDVCCQKLPNLEGSWAPATLFLQGGAAQTSCKPAGASTPPRHISRHKFTLP